MTVGHRPDVPRAGFTIRRAEPSDFAGVMATMASPSTYGATLQLPLPSRELWREKMARLDAQSFMIVAEADAADGAPPLPDGAGIVGHAALFPASSSPSPRRQHAMALGMSVRDDWQGRGVGSALMATLLDRADHWMPVLRMELTVFVDNEAACALYRKHGFVVEGTHRAYALRDGIYCDAYSMARLHPRQPLLPPALESV